ncbi:MAG: lytic murein transglycosylase [Rhodobacteraceae bacterium]|nr:lytic murein transglycosylase [Paracoccaceae bacterium]
MRTALATTGIGIAAIFGTAMAAPPDISQRPELRPIIATPVPGMRPAPPLGRSVRPVVREGATPQTAVAQAGEPAAVDNPTFRQWLAGFQARARAAGIRQATLDRAFQGVRPNRSILDRDRNQSEFTRTLWDYLDSAVSDTRIRNGRTAMARHGPTLRQIEQAYGVEARVVTAVWGLESAYGAVRGDTAIIQAMATLAYDGRRRAFFEAQLLAALNILQAGDVQPARMRGSWAGAMGHTQFMPTSYLDHAVDLTGDGRRDIWSDNPADALASTANYLRHFGWTYGQPWGIEVVLPDGFDYSESGARIKRPARHWNNAGVRLTNGSHIPDHGPCSILLPAGARGVALVIFDNFHVIARYNRANAYVIAVGHLSDRIIGGPPFQASWPRGDRVLRFAERKELQQRLTARGFSTGGIDGIIGPDTIQAVRLYQASIGETPDGYPSIQVLEQLR